MERKIATKLTPRIADFVNKKSGLSYNSSEHEYFNYPNILDLNGFKYGYHISLSNPNGDYEEVTEQEFINYFNEFEFGERVLCDDGIERNFFAKVNDLYYCVCKGQELNFQLNHGIRIAPFKSIQKLEEKIQKTTKEEKINKII